MLSFNAKAQTDTVFVYEDVIVYDTVVVYDTVFFTPKTADINAIKPKAISILTIDTVNSKANLLFISGKQTATIPINSIILNENFSKNIKKTDSMRKLSFLGVVFFAFQSITLAQSDYGISVGEGIWWARCNNQAANEIKVSKLGVSNKLKAGMYYNQRWKSGVTFEVRLNYGILFKNSSYKAEYSSELPVCQNVLFDRLTKNPHEIINYKGENVYTSRVVGEEESSINYHQLELPFQIGYSFGKFNPYVGINYSLKFFGLTKYGVTSEADNYVTGYNGEFTGINTYLNCFGLSTGVNYSINDRFKLKLNYYHALTADYKIRAFLQEVHSDNTSKIISSNYYTWKSGTLEWSLSISLKRKEKNTQELE